MDGKLTVETRLVDETSDTTIGLVQKEWSGSIGPRVFQVGAVELGPIDHHRISQEIRFATPGSGGQN
jgi:hypothetical protein